MVQRSLLPWLPAPSVAHIPETLQYCDPETTRMPAKDGGEVGGGVGGGVGEAEGGAERGKGERKSDKKGEGGKGVSSSSTCVLSECRGPRVCVLRLAYTHPSTQVRCATPSPKKAHRKEKLKVHHASTWSRH